jgi:hypothetical protein
MKWTNVLQPRLPFTNPELCDRIAEEDRPRCQQLLSRLMSQVIKAERQLPEICDEREDSADAS